MKIKKLKKLSILTLIFAFAVSTTLPAMASYYGRDVDFYIYDDDNHSSANQEFNLSVNSIVEIEKTDGSNTNAVVSVASPTSVTISTPIAVSYNVSSNGAAKIAVSATAPVSDGTGTVNALYGTNANDMTIVFTRNNNSAASSAVSNAASGSASAASNLNAVAFKFTPDTPTATEGTAPSPSVEDNTLIYEIDAGSFNLPFKVQGSSIAGTYSMDDAQGDYKATLTVSKIDG